MVDCEPQAVSVGGGEDRILVFVTSAPHRADGVDHIPGTELASAGDDSFAGWTASPDPADFPACVNDVGAARPMDGPVNTAPAQKSGVGSVHNGINILEGNVTLHQIERCPADRDGLHAGTPAAGYLFFS